MPSRRPRSLSILAAIFLSGTCSCSFFSPKQGRPARDYEKNVGLEFARQAEQVLPFFDEFEIFEFFNTMGSSIAANVEPAEFVYRFFVIKDPTFNAFAVPGGFIYFYSGLVLRFDTVDELAAVLSHEIAHVAAHHFLHRQKKATLTSLTTMAAAILASVFFPEHGGAIGTTAIAADLTLRLNYSREQEEEADRLGLRYLAASGYRIEGMTDMFLKFEELQRLNLGQLPTYFLTHPLASKRLEYVRMTEKLIPPGPPRPETDEAFERIKAIMRGRIGPAPEVLDYYRGRAEAAPDEPVRWHLLGLAAIYAGELVEAENALLRTVEMDPSRAAARRDLGRLFITAGRFDEAEEELVAALALAPDSQHLQIDMGSLYEALGDLDSARLFYRRAAEMNPESPEAHQRLGMALGKQSRFDQAHYHMGLGYKLQCKIGKALLHLTKALDLCRGDSERAGEIQKMIGELSGS